MTEKGPPTHSHKVKAGLRFENEFPCADPSCPVDAIRKLIGPEGEIGQYAPGGRYEIRDFEADPDFKLRKRIEDVLMDWDPESPIAEIPFTYGEGLDEVVRWSKVVGLLDKLHEALNPPKEDPLARTSAEHAAAILHRQIRLLSELPGSEPTSLPPKTEGP